MITAAAEACSSTSSWPEVIVTIASMVFVGFVVYLGMRD